METRTQPELTMLPVNNNQLSTNIPPALNTQQEFYNQTPLNTQSELDSEFLSFLKEVDNENCLYVMPLIVGKYKLKFI